MYWRDIWEITEIELGSFKQVSPVTMSSDCTLLTTNLNLELKISWSGISYKFWPP